jgi:hypothetical protein
MKRSRSLQTLAIRGFEQHPDKLLSVNQLLQFRSIFVEHLNCSKGFAEAIMQFRCSTAYPMI